MRHDLCRRALLLTGVFFAFSVTPALAQWGDLRGRFSVHVNGGFQSGSDTVRRTFVFRAYGEDARFEENHETQSSGILDLGGSIQVWEQLRVGASYSQLTQVDSTRLTGTVPNPIAINVPRTVDPRTLSLAHEEKATHLYAALGRADRRQARRGHSRGPQLLQPDSGDHCWRVDPRGLWPSVAAGQPRWYCCRRVQKERARPSRRC